MRLPLPGSAFGGYRERRIYRIKQIGLSLVILFMGMSAFVIWPRLQYQSGMTALETGRHKEAAAHFARALSWLSLPGICLGTGMDRFRANAGMGQAVYLKAVAQWRQQGPGPEVADQLEQAAGLLKSAAGKEPEDYSAVYWLARTQAAQETCFAVMYPGAVNAYDASVYFEKAMALRPAGISVRFLYARYLYRKGRISAIPPLVTQMAAVSPASYWDMRAERFFNPVYYDDVEAGLLTAMEERFVRPDALKSLSRLYWDMGTLNKALVAFDSFRAEREELSAQEKVYLGSLMVAAGKKEEGFSWFDRALEDQGHRDAAADGIYEALDSAGQFDIFLEYAFHARDQGMVFNALDLNVARGMIKQGLLPFARARLVQVNARGGDPEAYALLAKICEREKDWEQMARMAKDGLKLAPAKAELYHLLSKAQERKFGTPGD